MPSPHKGESKEEYVSRFMSSEEAKKSFPDEKQRLAVAHSKWKQSHSKGKETIIILPAIKKKESDEIEEQVYTFVAANTLPDRVKGTNYSGEKYDGEILSKNLLDKTASMINDSSRMGGEYGSYRTVSLFHDRVKTGDYSLEEAGFIVPGSATVQEIENNPGNYELLVDIEVNKHYVPRQYPDYTPEKINYKIQKGAMGVSFEYDNTPEQERIVSVDGKRYNYVYDTDDFRGLGFARPNLIGNPGAVRVKEILIAEQINKKGERNMDETKFKEVEDQLTAANAKIKELEEEKKAAEEAKDSGKVEEVEKKVEETQEKVKELKLQMDKTASKIKESVELAFSGLKFDKPSKIKEEPKSAKIKEIYNHAGKDFSKFKEMANDYIEANGEKLKEILCNPEIPVYSFEKHQTLKVKCIEGTGKMVIVPSAKTKDTIDASDMAESTFYQTNAMFADRYVAGITETFLKEDSLLTAMNKEQHIGGNDKYQWRLWITYGDVDSTTTAAVNPNVTSVTTTERDFEKMETPIREYRDGVEVTDFTQAHSMAAIGDLLGKELMRAAEWVTESMNSDLFKAYCDGSSGWYGFNGLIAIADSATYTSLYGKTRSAANRLLDSTTANTYVSTSEPISSSVLRQAYNKVLAHGSSLSDLAIVIHPTQYQRYLDTQDADIRHPITSMQAAPPRFGFNVSMIPFFDGVIPMILDYRCESSSGGADMFAVVDMSQNKGFNLVVSKPLGATELAKVGASRKVYVSFWGCTVYKSPRNVFVHTSLTTS